MNHDPIRDVCDCGALLSEAELRYYGNECEACVQAWSDRLIRWRHGEQDPELDRMYGVKRALH